VNEQRIATPVVFGRDETVFTGSVRGAMAD
jgi:hypothetical protein